MCKKTTSEQSQDIKTTKTAVCQTLHNKSNHIQFKKLMFTEPIQITKL